MHLPFLLTLVSLQACLSASLSNSLRNLNFLNLPGGLSSLQLPQRTQRSPSLNANNSPNNNQPQITFRFLGDPNEILRILQKQAKKSKTQQGAQSQGLPQIQLQRPPKTEKKAVNEIPVKPRSVPNTAFDVLTLNGGGKSANLQPSFNSFNLNNLGDYLPPQASPSGPGGCAAQFTTHTAYVTETQYDQQNRVNDVVTTVTQYSTTTILQPQTSLSTETITSTAYTTQFTTHTRTVVRTQISQVNVDNPAETRHITRTVTSVSTFFQDRLETVTSTNVIPSTIVRTTTIQSTVNRIQTQVVTNRVTSTLPGQSQFQTQFQTITRFLTQTIPGQTIINTQTVFSHVTRTVASTLPAQQSVVYSTQVIPRVSTIFSTQVVTRTNAQTQERTVFSTQLRTVVSTRYITNTQFNDQFVTVTSERVRTSFLAVPTQIFNTVTSTFISSAVQPQLVTDYRTQFVTVTIPGVAQTVYQTSTVFSSSLVTSYVTNNAVNQVTVTQTVPGNCGIASPAGYNYRAPNNPLRF